MKIFRIKSDPGYWSLLPVDRELWTRMKPFQLDSMRGHWPDPRFYIRDPVRTRMGDFHHVNLGALAYGKRVYESILGETIERSGEVLEATLEAPGEPLFIFNATACYNCLDRERTAMRLTPDGGTAIEVKRYAFHVDRIGNCNLFKIPETRRVELYVLVERDDPSDEFYCQYNGGDFTGLMFQEVWNDESSNG